MANEEAEVMVRPRSFPGELLAGGVGEVVCLSDAHFLLLAPPHNRGEVGARGNVGRGSRKGGRRGRRSSRSRSRRVRGHGANKVREDRVDVLMSSMPKGDSSLCAVTQAAFPFPAAAQPGGPISGQRDRGAVSQG